MRRHGMFVTGCRNIPEVRFLIICSHEGDIIRIGIDHADDADTRQKGFRLERNWITTIDFVLRQTVALRITEKEAEKRQEGEKKPKWTE